MRYALIDNSSLTGIQRLLGEIEVNNPSVVENDIITLENYLQAILFYDDIICIDDYKPTHRAKRINYFQNIRFISKDIFNYNELIEKADKLTDGILLEISGGKISDSDFQAYLNRLQMTFQFTWDMSSSKFFLTQKMLVGNTIHDHETFNRLHSVLFKENNERFEVVDELKNKKPKLFDSTGKLIEIDSKSGEVVNGFGDGMSAQFNALSTSLNWISQRTAFYVLAADALNADLFIQPIRQEFLQNIIRRSYPSYELGVFNDFRNSINDQTEKTLNQILSNSNNFGLSLNTPLFTVFFANKTRDSKKIIDAALEARNNKEFLESRSKLRELNVYLTEKNRTKFVREINLLASELKNNFSQIESKYGLGNNQGFSLSKMTFLFSSIPLIKDLDFPEEFDIRIRQLEFMKHLKKRKGFNAVYRNLINDLIGFENLGEYKEILLRNVKFNENAIRHYIKTESPEYIKASSFWKRPM